MKNKRVVLIISASILLFAVIGCGSYFAVIRKQSEKAGLITLNTKNLPEKQDPIEEDHVQLSMMRMHYVRYGVGAKTVILIHGNGGSTYSLMELAQYLANDYTVYCIDSRCHGNSSDPDVITYELMAQDVYEFIQAKLTDKPFVVGHSDGAIVALSLAAMYPDSIAACVSCGANSRPETFKWYFTLGVKIINLFKNDKLNYLMLELPDFTPEYLSRITVPTYIVAGEYDIMPLSDSVYISDHIKDSKLAIIKNANHSNYISSNGGRIYKLAT